MFFRNIWLEKIKLLLASLQFDLGFIKILHKKIRQRVTSDKKTVLQLTLSLIGGHINHIYVRSFHKIVSLFFIIFPWAIFNTVC